MSANPSGFVSRDARGRWLPRIRWSADSPPTPDGCRWCGYEQYSHAQTWVPGRGYHLWTAPTDAQRLARMRARRAARIARMPIVCRCGTEGVTEAEMYECEANDCLAHNYLAGSYSGGPRYSHPSEAPA